MLSLSKNHNPNYLAKVVRISNVRKHGNADKLQCTTIDGNNVIIGLDNKIGDLGVFFPLECQIDHLFISANNLFKDKEHNLDKEKSGFFEDNRRVKALKLRGEKSMGFWVPASYFSIFEITEEKLAEFLGMEFDTIHELLLVKKYEIYRKGPSAPG